MKKWSKDKTLNVLDNGAHTFLLQNLHQLMTGSAQETREEKQQCFYLHAICQINGLIHTNITKSEALL